MKRKIKIPAHEKDVNIRSFSIVFSASGEIIKIKTDCNEVRSIYERVDEKSSDSVKSIIETAKQFAEDFLDTHLKGIENGTTPEEPEVKKPGKAKKGSDKKGGK